MVHFSAITALTAVGSSFRNGRKDRLKLSVKTEVVEREYGNQCTSEVPHDQQTALQPQRAAGGSGQPGSSAATGALAATVWISRNQGKSYLYTVKLFSM